MSTILNDNNMSRVHGKWVHLLSLLNKKIIQIFEGFQKHYVPYILNENKSDLTLCMLGTFNDFLLSADFSHFFPQKFIQG